MRTSAWCVAGLGPALVAGALVCQPGPAAGQQPASAMLVNGQWFDGAAFRPDTVWMSAGVLRRRPQPYDTVIDLAGGFVVPAAGDAHQHRFGTAASLLQDGPRFVADGVFSVMVQDLIALEAPAELQTWRADRPDVVWTRMPVVDPTSGIKSYFGGLAARGELAGLTPGTPLNGRAYVEARTVADLDAQWDALLAANPSFLKVILGYGEDRARRLGDERFTNDPEWSFARVGLDPALLPGIVVRAHSAGRRISAHVETAEDFRNAVDAGVDMIAHLPGWQVGPTAGFTDTSMAHWLLTDGMVAAAAAKRIPVITTTWPKDFFDNVTYGSSFRRVQAANLRRLVMAGVPLAIGTDGDGTSIDEVQQLRMLGIDNLTLLRALVQTTPRLIFPDRQVGCLDDGCEASILVLADDPLADLASLRATRLRIRNGELLPGVETPSFSAVTRVGAVTLLRANQGPTFDNVVVFAGEDGVVLVDAAYSTTADSLRAAVLRVAGSAPTLLVNTHFHHAGGNAAFPEARIVAHTATAARMRRESRMYGMAPIGPWPASALPDTTVGASAVFEMNGERVQLIHLPNAHTDGDLAVVFPRSGVVATGDVFAPLLNPCDHPNGCRWTRYVEGIDRLLDLLPPDAVVFPGHGPASTRDEIAEFSALLHSVTEQILDRIAAGWSRNQIIDAGLPARFAHWNRRGVPPSFFLGNAYDAMMAER